MAAIPVEIAPAPGTYTPWDGGEDRESFARLLRRYMLRAGWSQNALGKQIGVCPSYLNRMCSGERGAPTRHVVTALVRALCLTVPETDRLMAAAGHLPPSIQKVGASDPTVAAVLAILTDDRIDPAARADYRACVEAMAARWGRR